MAYSPTTWVNGATALNATNMNNLEAGVVAAMAGVVNVVDYGAVGDDSTDDTTSIQSALTAGAGSVVVFPEGTYRITADLEVPANTVVTGVGTIHQDTQGQAGLTVMGSGVTIEGITLKGDSPAAYDGGEYAIVVVGTSAAARYTDTVIRGVEMYDWGAYGIYAKWITRFRFEGCYIHDCGYTGIGVLSGYDGVIHGNRVDNITPGSVGDMYGIILSAAGGSESVDPRSARVVVSDNVVSNVNWEAVDTHGGRDIAFTGNVLFDNYDNFALVTGPNSTTPTNIVVSGNTVFNTAETAAPSKNVGVTCWGGSTYETEGVVITGNSFRSLRQGVSLKYTRGTAVAGNSFASINGPGVQFDGWNEQFAVTGNTFTEIWHATESPACVEFSGYGSDVGLVAHNVLAASGARSGTVNYFGVSVLGTPSGMSITIGQNDFTLATLPVYSSSMSEFKSGGWYDQDPVAIPSAASMSTVSHVTAALVSLGIFDS